MSVYEVACPEFLLPVQTWCQSRPVSLCVLFGSQTTGKTHAHSDVDLAVWPTEALTSAQKMQWVTDLQGLLDKDVSLVIVTPDLDPVLGFEIVKNGRLLYQQNPELWLKERSRLWHAYNDSLPFRRAAYKQLQQFIKENPYGS
ncbi:MAG: nucleotidyltransferase domain-containing protein [Chloroflexota bacterium]